MNGNRAVHFAFALIVLMCGAAIPGAFLIWHFVPLVQVAQV
jgi:hypothetical protein